VSALPGSPTSTTSTTTGAPATSGSTAGSDGDGSDDTRFWTGLLFFALVVGGLGLVGGVVGALFFKHVDRHVEERRASRLMREED
jgi:hypothetical protein